MDDPDTPIGSQWWHQTLGVVTVTDNYLGDYEAMCEIYNGTPHRQQVPADLILNLQRLDTPETR